MKQRMGQLFVTKRVTSTVLVVVLVARSAFGFGGLVNPGPTHLKTVGQVYLSSSDRHVDIYDTTLRDGTQMEGISMTVEDKLKIARALASFGMDYIECGWPGSNPRDSEFFARAKKDLPQKIWARLVAFGSTRRKSTIAEKDKQLQELVKAGTPTVCIVAKAWDLHVDKILDVSREENLAMIADSVSFLKSSGKEVHVDLEHFFDGYRANPGYTQEVCHAALNAGADVLVLCDTNGGTMPWGIAKTISELKALFPTTKFGIHCHNDRELAVSNSLQAAMSGISVIQGTVNGIGERTGNANLMSILPSLKLEMGYDLTLSDLSKLTCLSLWVDELLNRTPDNKLPFVGRSAFSHKGGLHVSAVRKIPRSYEHIDPALVGNEQRILISDLAGRSSILSKVKEFAFDAEDFGSAEWQSRISNILRDVKELEMNGYTFEGADASLALMVKKLLPGYAAPFEVLDYSTLAKLSKSNDGSRSVIKFKLPHPTSTHSTFEDENSSNLTSEVHVVLECAEGNGPVDSLAHAMYKALLPTYPILEHMYLSDYKVRILDRERGTASKTRVLIDFTDRLSMKEWGSVGVGTDIIAASFSALVDGFEFFLSKAQE